MYSVWDFNNGHCTMLIVNFKSTKCVQKKRTYIDKSKIMFICWQLIRSYLLLQMGIIVPLNIKKQLIDLLISRTITKSDHSKVGPLQSRTKQSRTITKSDHSKVGPLQSRIIRVLLKLNIDISLCYFKEFFSNFVVKI